MANQRGETTSIGHFYNRCVDAVNNLFDTMSFWTHSKDVEFVDGKTAETKVGAINGITSDISGEADDIAASIKCVNQLNNSLTAENSQKFQFAYDTNSDKYGYIAEVEGADTFFPFNGGEASISFVSGNATTSDLSIPFTPSCNSLSIVIGGRRYGGVFTAYIKDSSENNIASALITASANNSGVNYAKDVSIAKVACTLKKDETYTLYIPSAGRENAHFAFAVYA